MILKNPYINVNSNNLSAYCRSLTLNLTNEGQDDTRNNAAQRFSEPGLNVVGIEAEFSQDFANLDSVLAPLLLNGTTFTLVIAANSGTAGSANPTFTGTFFLSAYNPFGQGIGEKIVASATFTPAASDLARAVS